MFPCGPSKQKVPKVWVPLGHFHNQQNIYLELYSGQHELLTPLIWVLYNPLYG